jgi:hypothetical protein
LSHSTGLSRHERRAAAIAGGKSELAVLSLDEVAALAGCSRRTIEREIAVGRGPATVDLSARRRGVTIPDFKAYISARRRPAPGVAA